MKLVVDTGVFSASLSRRRHATTSPFVATLSGNQVFLAAVTVAELRFRALIAGWGDARRHRLEEGIESTTVAPVTNALLAEVAEHRFACRQIGHPLADRVRANDLWVAASALHIGAALVSPRLLNEGSQRLSAALAHTDAAPRRSLANGRKVAAAPSSSGKRWTPKGRTVAVPAREK